MCKKKKEKKKKEKPINDIKRRADLAVCIVKSCK